jgi:hypothetical protein
MKNHSRRFEVRKYSKYVVAAIGTALSLGTISTANAAVVAEYQFTGNSLASSDSDPSTATSFVHNFDVSTGSGLGIDFFSGSGSPAAPSRAFSLGASTGATLEAAVADGDFVQFQVTPVSGQQLDFGLLTFDLRTRINSGPDNIIGPITSNVTLLVSNDGFATTLANIGTVSQTTPTRTSGGASVSTGFVGQTFDLSALDDQSGSLTLRLYIYDNSSSNDADVSFDNVKLNATASAIPEPGTLALLSLGGIACLTRRRSR